MNICNKCGTKLEGEDLINGCPKCGSKLFKFINTKNVKKSLKNEETSLQEEDSIESVKVEDRGVYELNLQHILDGDDNVFSDNEGNYSIDIHSLLQKNIKNKDDDNSKK